MNLRVSHFVAPILALALLLPISAGAGLRLADGTISGKVVKEDGTAASKVSVRVMHGMMGGGGKKDKAAQPGEGKRAKPAAETTTDDAGAFTVSVPAGDYVVQVGKRGESMGREKVTVKEGQTETVSIQLKAPKAK